MNQVERGHYYEELAAAYLVRQGYRLLERNYRFGRLEIDIIAMDGDYLAFIEVKYRKRGGPQHPLEAVDLKKQRHISRAARQYMAVWHYDECQPCRFDVVAFVADKPVLYKDAFSYQDRKGW